MNLSRAALREPADVIDSCETVPQLEVAIAWCNLWIKRTKPNGFCVEIIRLNVGRRYDVITSKPLGMRETIAMFDRKRERDARRARMGLV